MFDQFLPISCSFWYNTNNLKKGDLRKVHIYNLKKLFVSEKAVHGF